MQAEVLELRSFQKESLAALSRPQHVLCVSATGSGKSLIYERMAASGEYRILLVTPLVALARQQLVRLRSLGISVALGSGVDAQGPPSGFKSGAWIISPETLDRPSRQAALTRWRPNFMVVDECHCLWEWGQSFRPAFRRLPGLLREHHIGRSLWLTATLPLEARQEMRELMPAPFVELGSFDLPAGLFLEIVQVPWIARSDYLLQRLSVLNGAGIVFVATREGTLRIARLLSALGRRVVTYHAGMGNEERRSVERLIASRQLDIVVATSAFGMGMDYSHLKWVILWQAPTSLLSLTQAIGRVGRSPDSEARAIVLWDDEDFRLLEWTAASSQYAARNLARIAEFLRDEACRTLGLRNYFGHASQTGSCGRCDFCLAIRLNYN